MDRIDKVLLILSFIPLADAASTLFLLTFGGKESGPLAGLVYAQYGSLGLLVLAIFAFFALLSCVWFLKHAKRRINQGEASKLNRGALAAAVNLFFLGEAYLIGIIIQNFLVLLSSPSSTRLVIPYGVAIAYFVSAVFFTRTEMKQVISD